MEDHTPIKETDDVALYATMQAAGPLNNTQSLLLPSKAVPTPQRKAKETRLHLPLEDGTTESDEDIPVLTPLVMTEYVQCDGDTPAPMNSRRLSVTCVAVDATAAAAAAASSGNNANVIGNRNGSASQLANVSFGTPPKLSIPCMVHHAAALLPPNAASTPDMAVRDGVNFITRQCVPTSLDTDVELHVYDLSHGFLEKYGNILVGTETPGVYHSGIVCFGLEVYFEGGIGIAAAGRTRFGNKYKKHHLGTTKKTLTEFRQWMALRGLYMNQIHDYHPVRHNCHHFTNEAAQFLMGDDAAIPAYLFDTIAKLVQTPVGAAVAEAMTLTTHGIQSAVSRQLLSRIIERQCSVDMQLSASTACGVMTLPPTTAVLFRVNDPHLAKRLLLGIRPFITGLVRKKLLKPAALEVLEEAASALLSGADTVPPQLILNYVEMVVESLLRSPMTMWGPIFNSLRVAVLHKVCLITCAFHAQLLPILVLAARDFPRLLSDGRVAMMRFLCNFACSTHGAIVYADNRYRESWVSLVGLGLMDCSGAVVYSAACLALNLSVAIVITTSPSLKRDMSQLNDDHYALRLATLLLYNLRFRSTNHLPEPCFNMCLLALYRIMSSNAAAMEYIVCHSFKPRYSELLERCESNESRALVCLIKTLQDLFR